MKTIIVFVLSCLLSVIAKTQCVLLNDASASDFTSVKNYSDYLPAEAVTTIDNVFSYLNRQYGTRVKYTYINENNAYYRPGTEFIYLGIPFFKKLWTTGGATSVAIVICHEFSHYGQYLFPNNNRVVNGTHRVSELQADFIASYLMYNMFTMKIIPYSDDNFDNTMKNIFNIGDNGFNNRDHHGSYIERLLTVELVEVTQLGQDFTLGLPKIFELANKIYTSSGINICGNLVQPFNEITGAGFLYNKQNGKYYIIAIDFNIYPTYTKQAGQAVPIKRCIPEGKIDVTKSQQLNLKEQTLGFYVDLFNGSNVLKVYIFDKEVYTDETKTQIVPYLTWRKDNPFTPNH